jgi:hypothetical protein
MAVSSTTTTVSYTGDGSTTSFAVSFPFQGTGSTAELLVIERVIATGVETVKSFSTHYDVTGGNGSTGAVVFGSAPADTVQIHIRRNTTRTQTVDYTANDPFPADTHELALDRLAMAAHEIQEELDRSFKVSRTNAITTPEFVDNASARASKLLGFSSDGNTLEATTGRVNSVSVSTSTLGTGESATGSASYTDSTGALALSLGIPTGPQGAQGSTGAAGAAASIAVGSVTTGSAGSSATVTNAGSSSSATLNFTIPRGDTGATGPQGPQGASGAGGPGLDGGGTGEESVIRTNKNQISGSVSLTIPSGTNGMSAGPVTITSGSSVTVSSGAQYHIVGS